MVYTYFMGNSVEAVNSRWPSLLLPIPFVTMMLSVLYNIFIAILVGSMRCSSPP
jgi:hypothetical protein